jgi:hypothetical protein
VLDDGREHLPRFVNVERLVLTTQQTRSILLALGVGEVDLRAVSEPESFVGRVPTTTKGFCVLALLEFGQE